METNETNIDTSAFRYTHKVHNICMDDCKAWLDSPITKALINLLDQCSILCAVEFGDSDYANIHLIGKFDIKQAIIDRQKENPFDFKHVTDPSELYEAAGGHMPVPDELVESIKKLFYKGYQTES